jgi:hypothetical protein
MIGEFARHKLCALPVEKYCKPTGDNVFLLSLCLGLYMNLIGTNLGAYVSALTSDAINIAYGGPPSATFGQILADGYKIFHEKRITEAREILLSELRSGDRLAFDVDADSFYGLLFQYLNAVKIGSAKRNLRLLAQVVREGSILPIPFQPDEIASCAKQIADLSHEEILLLGELQRQRTKLLSVEADGDYLKIGVSDATKEALVPKFLPTEADFLSVASALQRSGLVRLPSVWGGGRVDTTPKFEKLIQLCDFASI